MAMVVDMLKKLAATTKNVVTEIAKIAPAAVKKNAFVIKLNVR